MYSATAFYIGNSKTISAAHAFDSTIDRVGVFISAMINEIDFLGNHFDRYVCRT